MIQILTGLCLAIHYRSDMATAFYRVNHIIRDVNLGWLLRSIHRNGARLFFVCLYIHIGRGMYYGSYHFTHVWAVGCTILLLSIATAFLGYVLPWGQIRFWGATVITNLFSAIPYIGQDIVYWLWGGFSVGKAALSRFFALHFILPFAILLIVVIHLFYLHLTGSNNPLGVASSADIIKFNPYFSLKDGVGFTAVLRILLYIRFFYPWALGDPDNFIPANPLVTPAHIQPEWYFLFAYAILRRIPNKLGGVLALFRAVLVFYFMPFIRCHYVKRLSFMPLNKTLFWLLVVLFSLLTWIGAKPVERPYIAVGQVLSLLYFLWFPVNYYLINLWVKHT